METITMKFPPEIEQKIIDRTRRVLISSSNAQNVVGKFIKIANELFIICDYEKCTAYDASVKHHTKLGYTNAPECYEYIKKLYPNINENQKVTLHYLVNARRISEKELDELINERQDKINKNNAEQEMTQTQKANSDEHIIQEIREAFARLEKAEQEFQAFKETMKLLLEINNIVSEEEHQRPKTQTFESNGWLMGDGTAVIVSETGIRAEGMFDGGYSTDVVEISWEDLDNARKKVVG